MNYATIKKNDVANGPGVRVSLFVSGCRHGCKGCFNKEAWDFAYGAPYTDEIEAQILEALAPSYIKGLSLLGGEPLDPNNRGTVLGLTKKVKALFPQKTIWCYSGYTFETDLLQAAKEGDSQLQELLTTLDVLVDGKFVEELKDLRLAFRGSKNQRIIDVPASLKSGRTLCLHLDRK